MKASEAKNIMLNEGFDYLIDEIKDAAKRGKVQISIYDMPIEYNNKLTELGYKIIQQPTHITISWNKI